MKSQKLNNLQVFTLLILVGFCSCQKDVVKVSPVELKSFEVQTLKEGGDDDEDPIVQGKVVDADENPINGALVEIYEETAAFPTDSATSDSFGKFEFQVPEGNYYLMVTLTGRNPVSTDVFNVDSDMQVTIQLN